MKTYKKPDGSLWAFEEDGSQDHLISADMRLLSQEELDEIYAPSKESRISLLQAAYESDLDKLNKAWLAALIADGIGEVPRQAAIKTQMADLADKLDMDILTIIME